MKNNRSPYIRQTRLRMARFRAIQTYIKSHRYPKAAEIAAALEVSVDVIYDDIAFLKDEWHDPIAFDFSKNGYHYTGKSIDLPMEQVTVEEVMAASLLESLCSIFDQLEYAKGLASLARKMRDGFAKSAPHIKGWQDIIEFHTSHPSNFNGKAFGELFEAAKNDEQATVGYRKQGQKEAELRTFETHKIVKVGTEWFIFARDPKNGLMRTFIPARVISVKRTGIKFKRDKKFSVKKRLAHCFHIIDGDSMYDITIEFDASVADMIGEKKWSGQQSLKTLPNGNVVLHLRLSSLLEVLRWITNWCGKAVPTGPYELELMTYQAGRALMANFAKRNPEKAREDFVSDAKAIIPTLRPEQRAELLNALSSS